MTLGLNDSSFGYDESRDAALSMPYLFKIADKVVPLKGFLHVPQEAAGGYKIRGEYAFMSKRNTPPFSFFSP